MRAYLFSAGAFLMSALAGATLCVLLAPTVLSIEAASYQPNHQGIGALAGGVSEIAIMLVALVCGSTGLLTYLSRRARRPRV